jgi:hypothetical protein
MDKSNQQSQLAAHQHVAMFCFAKKNVVKPAGFSYFQCQLHRMVPGQTGFALRRVERETRETTNKQNNIGGTR